MWRRRDNLHGAIVRATCIKYPVLTPEFYYDSDGYISGGKGFMMDLLQLLQGASAGHTQGYVASLARVAHD